MGRREGDLPGAGPVGLRCIFSCKRCIRFYDRDRTGNGKRGRKRLSFQLTCPGIIMKPENQGSNSQIALRRITSEDGTSRLMLIGNCTLAALGQQLQLLSVELAGYATDPELHWDLTGIAQMDDAGAVLLWR